MEGFINNTKKKKISEKAKAVLSPILHFYKVDKSCPH